MSVHLCEAKIAWEIESNRGVGIPLEKFKHIYNIAYDRALEKETELCELAYELILIEEFDRNRLRRAKSDILAMLDDCLWKARTG